MLSKIWDYSINWIGRHFCRPSSLIPSLDFPLNVGSELVAQNLFPFSCGFRCFIVSKDGGFTISLGDLSVLDSPHSEAACCGGCILFFHFVPSRRVCFSFLYNLPAAHGIQQLLLLLICSSSAAQAHFF